MQKLPPLGLALSSLALALPAPALASDLSVDGVTDLELAYGSSFQIALTGNPDLPALLFADAGPGPTAAFGEVLPLDLSPGMFLLLAGATDASGSWSVTYPTPADPSLAGFDLYLGAVVIDPADSNGLDFSNGAALHVVPPVGAGADQGGLVGRVLTLDGSGATAADGSLPFGTTLAWELVSQPLGSGAALSASDQLYPTFTPDVHGEYEARLTVTKGGASNQATTKIHAWDVALTQELDGRYFPTASTFVSGSVLGPPASAFSMNGSAITLGPGGSFGPVLLTLDPAEVLDGVLFEVTHADGTSVRRRATVAIGLPAWIAFGAANSAVAHLDALGLEELSDGTEETLEATDISTFVTAIPPTQIANDEGLFGFTIFSATVDFTGMSWNPDMTVDLPPTPAGVDGFTRLTNVKVDFDVWGELLEIPYSLTGDSTSSTVDISALLKLTTSAGQLGVDVSNVNVSLSGFQFDLHGFLGDLAQLFLIESWVKDQVVAAMEAEIGDQIGPIVVEMLEAFEFSLDLGPELGLDTQVVVEFTKAAHSSHGVTLDLDTQLTVGTPLPGSPSIDLFRQTPSIPPDFGPLTPSGQSYGGSLAASDDFLNLILGGLTAAGMLEGDLTDLFPDDGTGGTVLTTEVLAVLFPGAGFQLFPSGTVVDLVSHGVMAPVVRSSPGGPGLVTMDLAGMEVSLEVPTGDGPVPVLRLVLDGLADLDMVVEPDGTLAVTLLGSSFTPTVLAGFPGSNIPTLQAGSDFLVQMLLPQLTEALGVIPLPSLDTEGITLTTDEVGLMGAGSEFLGFWGGMLYTPPAP